MSALKQINSALRRHENGAAGFRLTDENVAAFRNAASAIRIQATEIGKLRASLMACETVMMIVEPRSNKADYIAALKQARAVLASLHKDPSP